MSDLSSLSNEQIMALLAEAEGAKALLQERASAANAEIIGLGDEIWEQIVTTVPRTKSKTGREGFDVMTVPYTSTDGVEYTVSVHVTDVKASEVGRARVKAEKDAAEALEKQKAAAAAYGVVLTK